MSKTDINDHLKSGDRGAAKPGGGVAKATIVTHSSEEDAIAAHDNAVDAWPEASGESVLQRRIAAEKEKKLREERRAAMPRYEPGPPPGEPLMKCGLPEAIRFRQFAAKFLKRYDAMNKINEMDPVTDEDRDRYRQYLMEVRDPGLQITSVTVFTLAYRMAYARDKSGVNRFQVRTAARLNMDDIVV